MQVWLPVLLVTNGGRRTLLAVNSLVPVNPAIKPMSALPPCTAHAVHLPIMLFNVTVKSALQQS